MSEYICPETTVPSRYLNSEKPSVSFAVKEEVLLYLFLFAHARLLQEEEGTQVLAAPAKKVE